MSALFFLSRTRSRFIANRLLNPCYHYSLSSFPQNHNYNHTHTHPYVSAHNPFQNPLKFSLLPSPQTNSINANPYFNPIIKFLSTSSTTTDSADTKEKTQNPDNPVEEEKPNSDTHNETSEFKHQEIEGPTVERDLSSLANEMRQVHEKLIKTIYNSSKALALLSLLHLSCGAWISYSTQSSLLQEVSIQSLAAFAFPFSLAFLLRQSVKPIIFFRKMEQLGRLQILTLSLQVAKSLDVFFRRVRVVSFFCVCGMVVGLLFSVFPK